MIPLPDRFTLALATPVLAEGQGCMCAMQPISKGGKPMAPKDDNGESRFNRKDVYTRVTDRIVADLEQGSALG